jgi:cytochrome c556
MNNAMVLLSLTKDQLLAIQHERHEGMEAIGKATKAANRELQGSSPDLGVVRQSASRINDLAQKASGWFPQGTGPELGNTGAKPDIWKNQKDFGLKLHNFQLAAAQFAAAATGSDAALIKQRFSAMGGTCKACHDTYRKEMKH